MKVIDKNSSVSSSSSVGVGKSLITASLAFTISTFASLKPVENSDKVAPNTEQKMNQYDELKIESDAYDMIRIL